MLLVQEITLELDSGWQDGCTDLNCHRDFLVSHLLTAAQIAYVMATWNCLLILLLVPVCGGFILSKVKCFSLCPRFEGICCIWREENPIKRKVVDFFKHSFSHMDTTVGTVVHKERRVGGWVFSPPTALFQVICLELFSSHLRMEWNSDFWLEMNGNFKFYSIICSFYSGIWLPSCGVDCKFCWRAVTGW